MIKLKTVIKISIIEKITFFYCVLYSLSRAFWGAQLGAIPFYLYLALMGILIIDYFLKYSVIKQKITFRLFFALYFIYIIFIIINLMLKKNASTYAIYEYIFYMLFFFAACVYFQNNNFGDFLYYYEIIGIISGVEAIWEFITGIIPYRASPDEQLIRRACGLVGTPLTLGMIMAVASLITIYLGLNKKKYHFVATFICVLGLLSTQSRGPLVGFVVGLIVLLYLNDYKKNSDVLISVMKTVLTLAIVLAIGYIIVFLFLSENKTVATLISRIKSISSWEGQDRSNELRQLRWSMGIEYFKNNPVAGLGVSSTGTHAITGINVESGVIKKLTETGIIGFVLYYLMFGGETLVSLVKCKIKNKEYYPIAFAIICTITLDNVTFQIIESAAAFITFITCFCYLFLASNDYLE